MSAAHYIYIPMTILVGLILGFLYTILLQQLEGIPRRGDDDPGGNLEDLQPNRVDLSPGQFGSHKPIATQVLDQALNSKPRIFHAGGTSKPWQKWRKLRWLDPRYVGNDRSP